MKRFYFTLMLLCLVYFNSQAQSSLCQGASLFCTGGGASYPASTNAGSAQVGANYGCLYSEPNPVWYFMQVANPGTIEIEMHSFPQVDIDFACWGPFMDPTTPCVAQLTAGSNLSSHAAPGPSTIYPSLHMIDCSYSTSWQEWCYIPNSIPGQYYIIMITNYSNQPCNIMFSQTGGTGSLSCTATLSPLPNQPDSISICSNPATLSALAGWTNYHWSTGDTTQVVSVTASGMYSITATLNGLLISDSVYVTLTQPSLNLNIGHDTTICGNANITLNAGSGFNSYFWNNGSTSQSINVQQSGNYSVHTTDIGNCAYNDTISVIINPAQSLHIGNDTALCHYGPLTLDAGMAFDSYQWSTSATTQSIQVNNSGTYYVTATNVLCATTVFDTINLLFFPIPNANAGPDDTLCFGGYVNLLASGGSFYSWSPTTNLIGPTTANPVANPTTTTTYTVTVSNVNGCTDTDALTLNIFNSSVTTTSAHCSLNDGTASALTIGGSGNYAYVWNTTPPQTTPNASNLVPGSYSVNITDLTLGCTIVKPFNIGNVNGPTVIISNVTNANCGMNNGGLNTLVNGTPPYNYVWSSNPPQTTPNLTNVAPGNYCVTITDTPGCTSTACATVGTYAYSGPEICMVTVDTATNYNMVVWEKPVSAGIIDYYIFRESNISGIYNLIGTQSYNNMSVFIDNTSNSLQQPYRYKLALNDNCGLTSSQGAYHQTIHLTISAGMGGSYNLIWNNYEGYTFTTYNIYRGSSAGTMTLLNSVSNNVTSYTDLNPLPGTSIYLIEAVRQTACNPTAKTLGQLESTISNMANSADIGIGETQAEEFVHVYPNPASGVITLSVSHADFINAEIEILNSMGQLLYKDIQAAGTQKIDISGFAQGVYFVRLTGKDRTAVVKFVKE